MSDEVKRTIVHMDLDSFFVSVELLKRPELIGKPVIIGGSSDRGVVASCSYEARKFGVHSAMPSKMAKFRCPHAIWIQGDMEEYSKYSKLVREIINSKAPLYEQASIDEFYLDVSGMDRFFGCFKWTKELRQYIIKESGLPISFGLSKNKTVSKVATNEAKPNGQMNIEFGTEKGFLAPLKVEKIPMIGEKSVELLNSVGVTTVNTLSKMPIGILQSLFGKSGFIMHQRANAIDNTPVIPYSEAKSISTERTFGEDTTDIRMLRSTILTMVEKLGFDLRSQKFLTGCLTIKIKYSDFNTVTKQKSISYTSLDEKLRDTAIELFEKLYDKRLLIRLVGVRFSHLLH